ncbi:MAX network transcriptional repressor b isoform X2 [Gouania willdenowi]|uniref:Max-binding protein MNT n=1 Tax=Gouania willdenowi TaxID=441366 RepID=A0A8C5GXN2_GOUWI|nr:max-binding protein MNT-like isoform X2 [Gouania willdenowi]
MSIDTLLEAARYLEWQAQQQQQQIKREEEQCKEKVLVKKEEELRQVELVSSLPQPVRANHITWNNDTHRQQPPCPPPQLPPPPPPPSLPPPQVPIAVIPMVPVVTATPSVPPLPLQTPIAAATTPLNTSLSIKNSSPPPQQLPPVSRHLLCASQLKVDTSQPLVSVKPSQPQPQVQIQYPTSISTNSSGSHHALVPHQHPPSSQPRLNGMMMDDLRGLDVKKRPGGAGTREAHNKLEKDRRAHLKECFETLKKNVPNVDEKKTSNLSVLRSALRYIQTLKRKEKEYEHEMERLAREKIATQQRLAELKNELSQCMDVTEIDRVLRQTIQPEDDQASTSTASEGEDNYEDMDMDTPPPPLASSTLPKPTPPILQTQPFFTPHLSIQHATLPLTGVLATSCSGPTLPQAIAPAPAPGPAPQPMPQPIKPPAVQVQPTVITHATVSHPSVIQAVNHALPANHKHLTHIAPSPGPTPSTPQPIAAAPVAAASATHQPIAAQPIGHITVHPVAHLPALYPQGVSVSQPTMVGHITHTFTHHALPHVQAYPQANANGAQVNSSTVVGQGNPSLGKTTAVLAPHAQLVGQATALNPVTMVTVPTFPVSTLKLA